MERYLLRDVRVPLSIDGAVWPWCEDVGELETIFGNYDDTVEPLGMWVYEIRSEVLKGSGVPDACQIMAISANENDAAILEERNEFVRSAYSPGDLVAMGWSCIGFDVGSSYGDLSGLMNCGYTPTEKPGLVSRFAIHLNERGLFDSSAEADEFRANCDVRVAEHAPFVVYGLWVQGLGQLGT
jgi:hypothetical protein